MTEHRLTDWCASTKPSASKVAWTLPFPDSFTWLHLKGCQDRGIAEGFFNRPQSGLEVDLRLQGRVIYYCSCPASTSKVGETEVATEPAAAVVCSATMWRWASSSEWVCKDSMCSGVMQGVPGSGVLWKHWHFSFMSCSKREYSSLLKVTRLKIESDPT